MSLSFTNNSDRVNVGSKSILDQIRKGTVIAWVYPTNISSTPPPHILDKRATGQSYKAYYLDPGTGSGVFAFEIAATDFNHTYAKSVAGSVIVNTWNYLVFSFDAIAGSTSDQKLYRGGLYSRVAEVASYHSRSGGSHSTGDDSSGNMSIGNVTGIDNFQTDGSLYLVGIWKNIQLPLSQIIKQQYYSKPVVAKEFCVGFWLLGKSGTSTQYDLSGNGNEGTISGATLAADPQVLPVEIAYSSSVPFVYGDPNFARGRVAGGL